jgi:hypothetical protein
LPKSIRIIIGITGKFQLYIKHIPILNFLNVRYRIFFFLGNTGRNSQLKNIIISNIFTTYINLRINEAKQLVTLQVFIALFLKIIFCLKLFFIVVKYI